VVQLLLSHKPPPSSQAPQATLNEPPPAKAPALPAHSPRMHSRRRGQELVQHLKHRLHRAVGDREMHVQYDELLVGLHHAVDQVGDAEDLHLSLMFWGWGGVGVGVGVWVWVWDF